MMTASIVRMMQVRMKWMININKAVLNRLRNAGSIYLLDRRMVDMAAVWTSQITMGWHPRAGSTVRYRHRLITQCSQLSTSGHLLAWSHWRGTRRRAIEAARKDQTMRLKIDPELGRNLPISKMSSNLSKAVQWIWGRFRKMEPRFGPVILQWVGETLGFRKNVVKALVLQRSIRNMFTQMASIPHCTRTWTRKTSFLRRGIPVLFWRTW